VTGDLFAAGAEDERRRRAPLADRMRPRTLDEVLGQRRLLAPGAFFRRMVEAGEVPSLIFWGPPGTGKTTLARLLAARGGRRFVALSAVSAGVKEIRETVEKANEALRYERKGTVLFLDEIHRFNKAQQDALLPHVESGLLTLFGATTENPSFEVNAALLSRAKVVVLEPLSDEDVHSLLRRALADEERGLGGRRIEAAPGALEAAASLAGGDARAALSLLEMAALPLGVPAKAPLTRELIEEAAQRRDLRYDKAGEEHWNVISAFHKALRGSDADAALYWLGRMLEAGEDPLFVARRMVRFASEDVGLADPSALAQAVAAFEASRQIGMPECNLCLAQAALFLALAPKSNAVTLAYGEVQRDIRERRAYPVPLHIRNAPTPLMKALGYGERYRYSHDEPDAIGTQSFLPPELADRRYYRPSPRGAEAELARRLAWLEQVKSAARAARGEPRGEAPRAESDPT
jgi:putative ATPase